MSFPNNRVQTRRFVLTHSGVPIHTNVTSCEIGHFRWCPKSCHFSHYRDDVPKFKFGRAECTVVLKNYEYIMSALMYVKIRMNMD